MRSDLNGNRTGYFIQKLAPHTVNSIDNAIDYSRSLQMYVPYMRLGDIYLMYAEACAAINGATGKANNCSLTAEDAINRLRDRVGMAHVPADLTGNKETFMDEVRRERAVELSFEGFRFCDLQRWLLLTEEPYTIKTCQEFDRVESDEWFTENDTTLSYGEYMRLRDLERRYLPASVTGDGGGRGSSLVPLLAAVAGAVILLLALRRRKPSPPAAVEPGGGAHAVAQPKPHAQAAAHAEPDEKTQELARTIRRFMETSPEIYGQDFSLEKLAARLGTHTRTASRAINDVFGVNFSTLLSQYRIDEACRRLSSADYANVTIQAVAVDLGFKSRSNFAIVFKKFTGVTPNEYQKEALGKKQAD